MTIDPLDLGRARLSAPRPGVFFGQADADLLAIQALVAEVERLRAATVKPDRETVARALAAHPWSAGIGGCHPKFGCDWHGDDSEGEQDRHAEHVADAILALLPGRTEAEVKAEALNEAADEADADPEFRDPLRLRADWLRARADRLVSTHGDTAAMTTNDDTKEEA